MGGFQAVVREHMQTDVVTRREEDTLDLAADAMLTRRVGCLPVVEGSRLVGLLSETDCLRLLPVVLDELKSMLKERESEKS